VSGVAVRRAAALVVIGWLAVVACVEDVASPPVCPDYCPGGQIVTVESLLTGAIERDSSFSGYRLAHDAFVMLAVNNPSIDSRPIFETLPIAPRLRIDTGSDTTTGPIVVDSARLTFTWLRRDANPRNVRIELYRLPLGLDSNTTFADVAPSFGAPLRVVNLDSLLASSSQRDSITGDTILSRDTLQRVVVVSIKLDSAQVPYAAADSGRVAFGVRVTADSNPVLVLGTAENGNGAAIQWFNRVDSAGTLVAKPPQPRGLLFDGFVSNQAPVTLDSNLTLGGVPVTRTLLRFNLPRGIRDSSQIIRATLILVPTGPPLVATGDTVFLRLGRLAGDVGAKSPLPPDSTGQAQSSFFVPTGGDSLRLEVTSLLRFWQADTTAVTAAFVTLIALERRDSLRTVDAGEAGTFTTMRFFSSRSPAFRPGLRLTYVPRTKFGTP
jgi:hypothetical protein